jgi:hypothetical protein
MAQPVASGGLPEPISPLTRTETSIMTSSHALDNDRSFDTCTSQTRRPRTMQHGSARLPLIRSGRRRSWPRSNARGTRSGTAVPSFRGS